MSEPVFDTTAPDYDPRRFFQGYDESTGLPIWRRPRLSDIDLSGRLGASVTSSTQITIAVGTFTFAVDTDPIKFKVGDDVDCGSIDPDNPDHHLVGTLIAKGGTATDPTLTLLINDVPDASVGVVIRAWELTVWTRARILLEQDISTASIDPTAAVGGQITITGTAGKMFNLRGGTIWLRSIAKSHVSILYGIKSYSGTSLILKKIASNSAVSETLSAWDVFLIDAPPAFTDRSLLPFKHAFLGGF